MKWVLALVVLLLFVVTVSATSTNFQNADDINYVVLKKTTGVGGSIAWTESTTGGNSYVKVTGGAGSAGTYDVTLMRNAVSGYTTYAAATMVSYSGSNGRPSVYLFSSDGTTVMFSQFLAATANSRIEVKMVGGTAYVYTNGVLVGSSGVLAQNPSYVGFGVTTDLGVGSGRIANWDDFVYGASEHKYVLGFPESSGDQFYIRKDITNPAASGFYNGTTNLQIDTNFTYGTWSGGESSVPPSAINNESIQLVNYFTGVVYTTNYTTAAYRGDIKLDVTKYLVNNLSAPMGYYSLHIPGTVVYSNPVLYKSGGATVTWGSKNYNTGDTGTVIYYVMGGGYWDTQYAYKVSILDIYGNFKGNTTITTSSGSVTHAWSNSDSPGVYYAWLIASKDGVDYILGSDYTELSGYVSFSGYINGAETDAILSGADVNITQGSTIYHSVTAADGNYSTAGTSFITGTSLTFNVTASGYHQYLASLVPLSAKTSSLNFTLNSTTPTFSGSGIGGIAREGSFDGTTITSGYGRPLSYATVIVKNTSEGESYRNYTNMAGWYLCDDGATCALAPARPYDVWGEKLGYGNSQNYTVVAA